MIKLWIEERWRYILIDDKIPCGIDSKPYFSMGYNLRFSFVSLIEKAMAKIHGSYKTLYEVRSVQRYMVELTGNLCIEEALH